MVNIYVFVPNLIGFARVVLLVVSLFYLDNSPYIAMSCYWSSAFLDVFDGMAARALDQSTIFGAVLDMVSDRCTTLCLMMTCSLFYPQYMIALQLLATLDISSHWFQMYSSMLQGKTSHKFIDMSANPLLRWYYWKPMLFWLCSANELFFMALYFSHFKIGWPVTVMDYTFTAWEWIGIISAPFFFLKHLIGLIQLITAVRNIAMVDTDAVIKRRSLKAA